MAFCHLFGQLDPSFKPASVIQEKDLLKRAAIVIEEATKIFKIKPVTKPEAIIAENEKVNTLFIAQIFESEPGLKLQEQDKKKIKDLITFDEGNREERGMIYV